MSQYQLAQINIAQMIAPLDAPIMADFVKNLAPINALAESAAGFIWRLQTEDGDATTLRPFGNDKLVNISVWHDLVALRSFVYGAEHLMIVRRRAEWFTHMKQASIALWWIPVGHIPTMEESAEKLVQLDQHGPTSTAFTFHAAFAAPDFVEPAMQ